MAIHIDQDGQLHDDQAGNLALDCPHCSVFAHVTPLAVPGFATLQAARPRQIGLVFRCDACNAPIFLRASVRGFSSERVELSPHLAEVERPKERYGVDHLPADIDTLFCEALLCYSHGLPNAFAVMCRRTLQAVFAHLGESGRLHVFDERNNVRDMTGMDVSQFAPIRRVLFGSDAEPTAAEPLIDEDQSALLLEVVKDLLHQCFVRKARLQQALILHRPGTGAPSGVEPLPVPGVTGA